MQAKDRRAALAARIRARYCAEYRTRKDPMGTGSCSFGRGPLPHLDGGINNFGRRTKESTWEKIADFCLEHGADYELLISEFFAAYGGTNKDPDARMLVGDKGLAVYANAHRNLRERVALAIQTEKRQAETFFCLTKMERPGESDAVVWVRVLTDPQADYSPLFRYCLARSVGAEKAAAVYREKAFWQYIRSPWAYDEAMAQAIPSDFREEAARVRGAQEAAL